MALLHSDVKRHTELPGLCILYNVAFLPVSAMIVFHCGKDQWKNWNYFIIF